MADPRLVEVLDRILSEIASQQGTSLPVATRAKTVAIPDLPSDEEWADIDVGEVDSVTADLDFEEAVTEATTTSSSSPPNAPRLPAGAVGTILPEGASVHGHLLLRSGNTHIHANIEGNIEAPTDGELIVGRNGVISGNVRAGRVTVHGLVYGDVEAVRITVSHGAVVRGNVTYEGNLIIEDGAEVQGSIKRAVVHIPTSAGTT